MPVNGRPVARTARAPDSKSGGWGFESLLACQFRFHGGECGSTRLEHWVVAPGVGGSSPLTHPINNPEFNFKGDRYASHEDRPYLLPEHSYNPPPWFFRASPSCLGVFENIRRRIEEPSYGMPRIRCMTSKKDCHSEPSFLSSRAKRGISS